MATPGFHADLEALLLRAAATEGPVGGTDIGDARRFSFERFKRAMERSKVKNDCYYRERFFWKVGSGDLAFTAV